MKKLCFILTFFTAQLYAQITVDDTSYTTQQLVENVLINSACATTSGYQSGTGLAVGINGIGYFERNGSDFPFENGIVLSTGRASKVVGPNIDDFSGDGVGAAWFGDSDLENITQTATTQNASYIEFDFIPLSNAIRFNFLFASEEYYLNYPCQFSDVFAFILTDANGVSRNLAVIPGTNIPVKVTEIHEAIPGNGGCGAKNEAFFDKYNDPITSSIGLNGQTVPMEAFADVNPGERYTIKLVIGDFQDGNLDSAVFIEGGSFIVGAYLGEDRTIANGNPVCEGETFQIGADVFGSGTYVWSKDGVVLPGETAATLDVTETGLYNVDFNINSGCIGNDEIFVEFVSSPNLIIPDVLESCSADGDVVEIFNLTQRNDQIANGNTQLQFNFYESQADVSANTPIINFESYENISNPQRIIVEAISQYGCKSYTELTLQVNAFPTININPQAIQRCDTDGSGNANFDLTERESSILNGVNNVTLSYYFDRGEAAQGNPSRRILNTTSFRNTQTFNQTIYIRAEAFNNSCSVIFPLELQVISFPELTLENEYSLCLDEFDTPLQTSNVIETGLNEIEYSFVWYRGNTATDNNRIIGETSSFYEYTSGGDYTVRITNSAIGCAVERTVFVRVSRPPLSLNVEVLSRPFSGNSEIRATASGNGEYLYALDGSKPQSSGVFSGVPAGNHIVTVFDALGCGSLSEEVIIIDYPRFFTPNGDGMNDTWDVSAFSSLDNLEIYIFDRYGKLIKVLNSNQYDWDGTLNGNQMPSDDYWFQAIFSENNVIKEVKGHFALKR